MFCTDCSSNSRISKIRTQKPRNMQATEITNDPGSPLRKMVTLSWDPTTADIGKHPVCFSALDSDRYVTYSYIPYYINR